MVLFLIWVVLEVFFRSGTTIGILSLALFVLHMVQLRDRFTPGILRALLPVVFVPRLWIYRPRLPAARIYCLLPEVFRRPGGACVCSEASAWSRWV